MPLKDILKRKIVIPYLKNIILKKIKHYSLLCGCHLISLKLNLSSSSVGQYIYISCDTDKYA